MAHQAGVDHEQRAKYGKHRDHIALQRLFVGRLAHPVDEDRDIHRVQRHDGQLGSVEAEDDALKRGSHKGLRAAPGLEDAGEDEIGAPEAAEEQAHNGGVAGHVGFFVDLAEELGRGTLAAAGKGINAAGAAEHQAVHGAGAGDRDEEVQDVSEQAAEDVDEGPGGALAHQHLDGGTAGNADVVADIGRDNDDGADDQGLGKILLGILQLGIDAGGNDPALIGEGGRTHRGQQGRRRAARGTGRGKVADQHVLGSEQAHQDADHRHQAEGDELNDRGAGLELAGKLRGQGVHRVGADQVKHHEDHALRSDDAAALGGRDQKRKVRPA